MKGERAMIVHFQKEEIGREVGIGMSDMLPDTG